MITEEFTIRNDSAVDRHNILIKLSGFKMGLTVFDADGCELAYLSNYEMKQKVENLDILREELRVPDDGYILWIELPLNRVFLSNEVRIIKLVYYDIENFKTPLLSFFNTPYVRHSKQVEAREEYDTFFCIESPPDCRIKYEISEGRGIKDLYANITNNFVSIRIPHRSGRYLYSFKYYITLDKLELRMWKVILPIYLVASLTMFIDSYTWTNILNFSATSYLEASIILGTINITLITILQGSITTKIKFILSLSLILNIMTVLICL